MIQKFEGVKTTLWSGLFVALSFVVTIALEEYWQLKIHFIEQVLLGVFVIGILFSAQFSRSRFSILIALCMIYYLAISGIINGQVWLNSNLKWLYISSLFILSYLAVVKDRGLLSVHGVLRILAIVICIGLAKLWLIFLVWFGVYIKPYQPVYFNPETLTTNLPLFVCAIFILYRSLRSPNLLTASLLTSLVLMTLFYNQQFYLPVSIVFMLVIVHFILVVVVDSYYLAYRDELTNLPSRRALNQYALSLGRKYCVAMLDIDHFKKFNDTYGHDIGDQVLKLVAAKLAEIKSGGRVFRYGGEEFTAIFPRKLAEEAQNELEKLRQSIADYKIVIRHPIRKTKKSRQNSNNDDSKTVSVTISIGVATREQKEQFEQVVKKADLALYRAKKKGRNNVSF